MKFIVATLLVWSACVTGAVIRRDVLFDKEANDMASGKCAPVAAIFARGTFDEGCANPVSRRSTDLHSSVT